jgi:metal-responsive CopG/Arc/MetJ family transcriptional regulator
MTTSMAPVTIRRMGRKKRFSVNIRLPLPDRAFVERIDKAAARAGVTRVDFIRDAITKEIERHATDRRTRKPGGDR